MQILDRGLIFDASQQDESRCIAYFTSLCSLNANTLLAGFQVGRGKHAPDSTIGLCRSDDAGATWRELNVDFPSVIDGVRGSLAAAEMVQAEPGRLLLFTTWFDRSDPERPLFDPVTEGVLRSKQLWCVSGDEGNSWGPWQELHTPGLTGRATTGPPLRWNDGTIAYAFESFKDFDDPRPARHAAWLTVSRDGARTWSPPLRVAQHPQHEVYYWDQRLCGGRTRGEFYALFWTHDLRQKRDLRVHFSRGLVTDTGIQLDPIHETSMPGQIAAPLWLEDGRLLAFVVDRSSPGTMKLWTSHDEGRTWPESDSLVVHTHQERARLSQGAQDIDFAQYWEDMGKWTFGHPAIRQLDPSRILVAWYAGTPDRLSLHWARIALT